MNRKRWPILCAIALFAVAILVYANFQKKHTFVLANDEGMIKSEQIQPLFGTVKVSGDCDTDVVFTDMETGEKICGRVYYIWCIRKKSNWKKANQKES